MPDEKQGLSWTTCSVSVLEDFICLWKTRDLQLFIIIIKYEKRDYGLDTTYNSSLKFYLPCKSSATGGQHMPDTS